MRNIKTLHANPLDPFNADAVARAATTAYLARSHSANHADPENIQTRRTALQYMAQAVWTDGEDKNTSAPYGTLSERGAAFEVELAERLEALLDTLDRYNDL